MLIFFVYISALEEVCKDACSCVYFDENIYTYIYIYIYFGVLFTHYAGVLFMDSKEVRLGTRSFQLLL